MRMSIFLGALSGALLLGAAWGGYQWYTAQSQASLAGQNQTSAENRTIRAPRINSSQPQRSGQQFAQAQNTATDGGVAENYQDWTVLCQPPAANGQRCLVAQEITLTETGQRLLLLSMERDSSSGGLRAGIVLTIDGQLQNRIGLTIEGTNVGQTSFAACDQASCRAVLPLPFETVDLMKRGLNGTVDMAAEDGAPIRLPVSLSGFTASWNRMLQLNG